MATAAKKSISVVLMAIMVAGGVTFAFPPAVPAMAQQSNPNLSVSAESSAFGNYFSGAQVVEVVIIDPDIDETNEAKGEPDVTVNGNKLRMVQATDGKWYAYVADRVHAGRADATVPDASTGKGLDFGTICTPAQADAVLLEGVGTPNVDFFSDTTGVAFPMAIETYQVTSAGPPVVATSTLGPADCSDARDSAADDAASLARALNDRPTTLPTAVDTYYYGAASLNVVREAKAINDGQKFGQSIEDGGSDVSDRDTAGLWPFIQLYDFNPTGEVIVRYNRGGGTQSVTLNYDTVNQYAALSLDRATYPPSSQVHFTITDTWLNIDPTDEDSWTWDVEDTDGDGSDGVGAAYYQAFDENGMQQGDNVPDVASALGANLMCDRNCVLLLDRDTQGTNVVEYADNADSNTAIGTGTGTAGLLTVTETSAKSGVFNSFDQNDASVLVVVPEPPRDTTATINYNETPRSISVGFATATIDIQPTGDAWLSGQEIPIVLTDADFNRNTRADEDFTLLNADAVMPGILTGTPATVADPTTTVFVDPGTSVDRPSGASFAYTDPAGINPQGALVTSPDAGHERFDPGSLRSTVSSATSSPTRLIVVDWGDGALVSGPPSTSTVIFTYDFSALTPYYHSSVAADARHFDLYLLTHASDVRAGSGDNNLQGATHLLAEDTVSGSFILPDALHTVINGAGDVALLVFTNPAASDPQDNGLGTQPGRFLEGGFPPSLVIADLMSFGFSDDGVDAGERFANQVVRLELEETADNTGVFGGTLEYVMVNQLNIAEDSTYGSLALTDDEASLIAIEDLTDEDTLTVTYYDTGRDGVVTQVSDDEAAPTHSGTVSFDATSYKIADTVTVTLRDADLNTNSDTVEVYTVPSAQDYVGRAGGPAYSSADSTPVYERDFGFGVLGRLADITFDDSSWDRGTGACASSLSEDGVNSGLQSTGFTLRETSSASGVFEGDFQVPARWCAPDSAGAHTVEQTVTGLDMEVNYVDYRDASGEIIEVGDGAGIRANTGSVSLDRPVYPVPFGSDPAGSHFKTYGGDRTPLPAHPTTIHVRVTDPDFDVSASGSDTLSQDVGRPGTEGDGYGPLKVSVRRGSDEVVLAYAGGGSPLPAGEAHPVTQADIDAGRVPAGTAVGSTITRGVVPAGTAVNPYNAIDTGSIAETAPSSGTFELDLDIAWDHGPRASECPGTAQGGTPCILQGDILLVEYTDPADASGNPQTVTDSATFDMRNAVLRSDKSVYIIGSDMILTLIEPDLDLDNDTAETYTLDLIEWDDDDSVVTLTNAAFDPEPTSLRETGDSTGIFQVVVEIPSEITSGGSTDDLERGEEIELEYQDWSPAGADYVGETDEEIEWSIYTSDFGATIDLDQAVYTWTDKVFVTVVAPDHNFDSNLIDRIGDTTEDPLQISTREGGTLDNYVLTETGTDTGIFSGEIILTGFAHDADGDPNTGNASGQDRLNLPAAGRGPTDGTIAADDDDGITVSYEYNDDEHVIASAVIRWNVGDTQWLEASYPASGSGVVRVVDPDMNWNPEAVDNFEVDVYSDADAGGINLTVTETQEATGIFEGTVIFTLTDQSSGHRLRVAEGDTVTARYDDNTLPDPYTRNDELEVEGTTIIGTLVPPLERAVVSNVRLTDNSGNPLDTVAVGQQVQVTGQVASGQETDQAYAYLVQINDSSDVTLSLTWTSGTLNAGQTLSPSMSWQPSEAGEYTATVFVWESIDNPTALSPQQELSFTVG